MAAVLVGLPTQGKIPNLFFFFFFKKAIKCDKLCRSYIYMYIQNSDVYKMGRFFCSNLPCLSSLFFFLFLLVRVLAFRYYSKSKSEKGEGGILMTAFKKKKKPATLKLSCIIMQLYYWKFVL